MALKWINGKKEVVVKKELLRDAVENGVLKKDTQLALSELSGIPILVSVGRPKKKKK